MKYILIVVVLILSISRITGQDVTEHHKESETKNIIALFAGSTHIVQSGINMPTFGIEYARRIFKNFAVGGIIEYEAGQHIIIKDGHSHGEEIDYTRKNSLLIIPTVYYVIHHLVVVTVGYGVEFEEDENLGLLKVGLGLELQLKNPRWIAYPNASWDHTNHFDGIVYGFSIVYAL